jgi:hypothetical protein
VNENLIKAIADSVGETLLSERGRTSGGLALLAEQIKNAESAFSSKNDELTATVDAATASLKADLRGVASGVAEALAETAGIKSRLSDLQARLADLATTEALSTHIGTFETTRTELLGWIEDLKSATETADTLLGSRIVSEIGELKSAIDGDLAGFALKLNAFEEAAASAAKFVQTHFAEKLTTLQSAFEAKLLSVEGERSAAAAEHSARLSAFSDEVAKLLDAVSKQDIAALESGAALTALEEQHAALAPQLANAFAAIEETKSAIEASASSIKSDIQLIRAGLEADAVTFAELASRYPEKGDKGDDGEPGVGIIVKQWEPGIYREGSIVQYDLGRYAKALRDTVDAPGGGGDDWARLGTSGFGWKGVKREGEAYEDGDFFIDDGTAFLVIGGKARMFAKRGEKGNKGDKGDKGDIGLPAPAVVDVTIAENRMTFLREDGEMFGVPLDALAPFIKMQTELAVVDALKKLGLVR